MTATPQYIHVDAYLDPVTAVKIDMSSARIPDKVRVIQEEFGGPYRVEVDGHELPWGTVGGVDIRIAKGELSSVTINIPAFKVEVVSGWSPPEVGSTGSSSGTGTTSTGPSDAKG